MLAASGAFAAAGKVLFVSGSVLVEGDSGRSLKAGDSLEVGDVVVTGTLSRAQILMADGARIALRADSRFRIDQFSLPSNVAQPGAAVAVAASGKSVTTLLKGGFSTRDGSIAKTNPSGYEMRTPVGTLGIRGTYYTVVFCRGDCADVPGLPAGQPIADGLYIAVDEGAITFNGRGLALTLTAPAYEFVPLETSEAQQLTDPPVFLRNDAVGAIAAAGRPAAIAAANGELANLNDRSSPKATPAPGTASSEASSDSASEEKKSSDTPPEQRILAVTRLGRTVELNNPLPVSDPQASVAASIPAFGQQQAFTAAATRLANTSIVNGTGSLLQFDAPLGSGATAPPATYQAGTAALIDVGSNGATGLRWGRWTGGTSTAISGGGNQTLDLTNASLHWIIGPSFELVPALPVSGSANFILAGGTTPTDTSGHLGTLNGGLLNADFTAQQVTTSLSLDINGFNWIASGRGSITAGTVQFGGTFDDVLIDGRIAGAGQFSGFFSAGATTPDQLNGVGLSYGLTDSLGQLGTVSGVAALVLGTGQPFTPPTVVRDVAYSVGVLDGTSLASASGSNTKVQFSADATGNLTSLTAPLPRGVTGGLRIGTASNVDAGFDAGTGIRWGRWEGGAVDVVVGSNPAQPNNLANESLHWIAGGDYGSTPVVPQIGTATYALVGNTVPTDTLGDVGALGAASFSADFTNHTVGSALSLTIAGNNWYAAGTGTFGANSTLFSGTYDTVNINNLMPGTGNFSGFFAIPRMGAGTVPGAGLTYSIAGSPAALGITSGALAFQEGTGVTVTPPVLGTRDIASALPGLGFDPTRVLAMDPSLYAVDANFNLTRFQGEVDGDPPHPATFEIFQSAVAESDVDPLLMMRWGRWSGGTAQTTDLTNGEINPVDLSQSSLHWVETTDRGAPPVLPTSGTISYQLAGWTTPTDRLGNLGTLNSATLDADFTSQSVTSTIDVTVGGLNWLASGTGSIGAQGNIPAHHFTGGYNAGQINPIQGQPLGSFSGFFTNTGAGLTYSIGDAQFSGATVEGAIVFRKP